MKLLLYTARIVLLTGLGGLANVQAQVPVRVLAGDINSGIYPYSGILWNEFSQGSGTVVGNPRTVASAAHVVYDDEAFSRGASWLGGNYFLAKHHSGQDPSTTGLGVPLRGFWSFSTYSGGATDQAFSSDFVVHYAYADLASGGYSGWSSSASTTQHPLNLAYQKILIGYPSTDSFYLNRTGPFTASFKKTVGRHFWNDDVAVVSGMSGGGAFIYNSVEAEYQLAGVIVSGNANDGQPGTGVRALDTNAVRLLTAAATSADRSTPVSRTVTLSPALAIPDATRRWTVVKLPITDLPSKVEEVVVSCTITHPWISDLQVVLRAPSRKTRTLHNRQGYGYEDLTFDKVSASTSFRGTKTNGEWELLVRDLVGDDTGTINSVELTVTGR